MRWLKATWRKIKRFFEPPPPPPPIEEPPPPPEEEPPPPASVRDRCLDMSNYWLPGPISDQDAHQRMQLAKDQGFTGIIAGTQVPSLCNQQVKAALSVGMWADIYHYINWSISVTDQANTILYAIEDVRDRVNVVWIDIEETPPNGWSHTDVLDFISRMVFHLWNHGCIVGIYTSHYKWNSFTGNSDTFNHLMLWPTEYDEDPPFDASWWARKNFGGWEAPTWVQFAENANVAGMNVDLNERYIA